MLVEYHRGINSLDAAPRILGLWHRTDPWRGHMAAQAWHGNAVASFSSLFLSTPVGGCCVSDVAEIHYGALGCDVQQHQEPTSVWRLLLQHLLEHFW